jgi:RNA polymerase sigma-54 factor
MSIQTRQTAQQRLILAPNVTLALDILRMPAMELQAFLRAQVEDNPLLEAEESEDQLEADAAPQETNGAPQPEPPPDLEEDWLAHWREGAGAEQPEDGYDLDDVGLARPESFHDSLRMQLGCQTLSAEERRLGEALIDRLTEDGYLDGDLAAIAQELGASADRLEAALRIIQRLDPPGVGARDLRECLMLQLEQGGQGGSLAYRILRDHFPLFARHQPAALAKATGATLGEIEEAKERLKRLHPKPGRIFAGELPPAVTPDLLVVKRERHYDVELNEQAVPRVTISRAYQRMLRRPDTPADAREFLAAKFRKAAWLIRAIDERNATLLAIGRCLISLQREFLEQGPQALKPLTQSQVAGLIGRHASTVSRAITGKSIDTPCGIFRLEQLFASGIPQEASAACVSDARIKSEIQRLIAEEDAQRPLSDEALALALAQRRISVARRTIAKYRTSLNILPAHLRRRRL